MSPISSAFAALRSGQGLKGQLMRGGVGSVAIKIGSTLLNVVLAIVLARVLGAEGFGVYSFVFALITIMAIPAQMGLPNLVVRETAKAQAAGDWALMKGLWRWSSVMALAMSVVLMAIGGLAAWIFAASLPEGGLAVFYWGLVLVPLVALGNLRGAALRGLRHVVQGQLPEFILRPAFLIALVLSLHFGLSARALTASDAMMLHAVASLVAFAIGAWLLLRARPGELAAGPQSTARSSLWLKSALPLGLVEGMQLINQNFGLIALGIFVNAHEVGLFRVAQQGATFVSFALVAINMAVSPQFARLYAQGDIEKLRGLVKTSARISFLTALPLATILVLFGDPLLKLLFGAEFGASHFPLVILALGQLAYAFAGPAGYLLYMTGHERDVLWSVAISVVINVIVAAILVPELGALGAAISATCAFFVWNGLLAVRVFYRLGFDGTAFAFPKKRSI